MATTGGSSARTSRVLDPAFVERLEEQPLDELRRRRDEALAEREYESYLRRLVQVRHDILRVEQARRAAGEEPVPVMERLASVLSAGPKGSGRGEALRLNLSPVDVAEAERRADEALAGLSLATPEDADDDQLGEALEKLEREERSISDARAAVIGVHDRLQQELKRRYREDPTLITH